MTSIFYFTPKQVAGFVPVSEEMIRKQIRTGMLNARKLGRAWLIPASEVERVFGLDSEQIRQTRSTFK